MREGEPIVIPPLDHFLTPEEKQKVAEPDKAVYNVFVDGKLLPVGRMFGMDGQIVTNPLHAYSCTAFNGQWQMVGCRPGDVTPRLTDRPWLRTKR